MVQTVPQLHPATYCSVLHWLQVHHPELPSLAKLHRHAHSQLLTKKCNGHAHHFPHPAVDGFGRRPSQTPATPQPPHPFLVPPYPQRSSHCLHSRPLDSRQISCHPPWPLPAHPHRRRARCGTDSLARKSAPAVATSWLESPPLVQLG